MIYAGIGSRETPQHIMLVMRDVAFMLAKEKHKLRSGRAVGADTAFEYGCEMAMGDKEIYLAEHAVDRDDWKWHAKAFHPVWSQLGSHAKLLHARNSAIMLGMYLKEPVDFVLCWTKGGKIRGGTGQALRIAEHNKISVFNFANVDCTYPGPAVNGVIDFVNKVASK